MVQLYIIVIFLCIYVHVNITNEDTIFNLRNHSNIKVRAEILASRIFRIYFQLFN